MPLFDYAVDNRQKGNLKTEVTRKQMRQAFRKMNISYPCTLFSWYLRFDICPLALLPAVSSCYTCSKATLSWICIYHKMRKTRYISFAHKYLIFKPLIFCIYHCEIWNFDVRVCYTLLKFGDDSQWGKNSIGILSCLLLFSPTSIFDLQAPVLTLYHVFYRALNVWK